MNKLNSILWKLSSYLFPLFILAGITEATGNPNFLFGLPFVGGILGVGFMIWFIASTILAVLLLIAPSTRAYVISKLSQKKERDEREAILVGEAAKFSFIATSGVVLALLFLSTLTYTKQVGAPSDATPYQSITIGDKFLDLDPGITNKSVDGSQIQVKEFGLPLSKTGLLLLILCLQILTFVIYNRRAQVE